MNPAPQPTIPARCPPKLPPAQQRPQLGGKHDPVNTAPLRLQPRGAKRAASCPLHETRAQRNSELGAEKWRDIGRPPALSAFWGGVATGSCPPSFRAPEGTRSSAREGTSNELGVSRLSLLIGVAVILALGAGGVAWIIGSRTRLVATTNILGEQELCTSCHPFAKHRPVAGHPKLEALGCVPCHGGSAQATEAAAAHSPQLGEGRDPFLPKGHYQVACGRCHILGQVKGMERLVEGHRSYFRGTCMGCHGPGRTPPEIGPSLQKVAPKPVAYLRRWLLDSRSVLATASMWSLRDPTYQDYFADTPEGNARLDALIGYVLMVSDSPQRAALASQGMRPKLRIDAPCSGCHLTEKKASTTPHRCVWLKRNESLRCSRCHSAGQGRAIRPAGLCPQIAGASHLCKTCHLRSGDGADERIKRALDGK